MLTHTRSCKLVYMLTNGILTLVRVKSSLHVRTTIRVLLIVFQNLGPCVISTRHFCGAFSCVVQIFFWVTCESVLLMLTHAPVGNSQIGESEESTGFLLSYLAHAQGALAPGMREMEERTEFDSANGYFR